MKQIFERLRKHQIFVSTNKYELGSTSLEFSGHEVSNQEVSALKQKIASIEVWPILQILKEIISFLSLTTYYQRFIEYYLAKAKPLTELTQKA